MEDDHPVKILLNKAHYPVTVLGPGVRAGIWVQGCTIRCHGCISRDTWAATPDAAVEVEALLDWIRSLTDGGVEGVTISGGEPFDQPQALLELVGGLDAWRVGTARSIDVLCYTGRGWEEIEGGFPKILKHLDAVVTEPFVEGLATEAPLRGYANQRVIAVSALGHDRYSEEALALALAGQRERIQLEVDGETIRFIGIPQQGDMSRVEERLAEAGIGIRRHSWLT